MHEKLQALGIADDDESFMPTNLKPRPDGWLVAATFILLAISVLMVFSTTAVVSQEIYGDSTSMIKRHLAHIILGLLFFWVLTRFPPHVLAKFSIPLLFLALGMLLLVLIPQIGHDAGGARRWFAIGSLRMQPGELSKILIIIYFSSYIGRHRRSMRRFVPGVVVPLSIISIFAVLLLLEPDFGSTVVVLTVVFCQLLMVAKFRHLMVVGVVALGVMGMLIFTSAYRFKRLVTFLDPFADASSSGYQLIQSLIAVGSGGVSGAGLGSGQQKLFYLPAAHTDFIYAVIAEELGLLGAVGVLAVFVLILFRGLKVARALSSNAFLCSLAAGCTLLTVVPAFLNIGVVTGMLPTKGMVLPLVAYGGTAMVVHLGTMGILIRLSQVDETDA